MLASQSPDDVITIASTAAASSTSVHQQPIAAGSSTGKLSKACIIAVWRRIANEFEHANQTYY